MLEEFEEGVDYHRDGADLSRTVLVALLVLMACPVILAVYLISTL